MEDAVAAAKAKEADEAAKMDEAQKDISANATKALTLPVTLSPRPSPNPSPRPRPRRTPNATPDITQGLPICDENNGHCAIPKEFGPNSKGAKQAQAAKKKAASA
jgi:hypothetical protein